MTPPSPRLLLAFAEGVGPASLTALRLRSGPGAVVLALTNVPPDPAAGVLGPANAATELRDLGVSVDRTGVLFRSPSRLDDAAIAAISSRATGPAQVTILWLTSVLDAARAGGLAAVPRAVQELRALLEAAADRLRSGERPELWFVGLGEPHPVQTMFDIEHHWRARVTAPLSHELRLLVNGSAATVSAQNQRALDLARELLGNPPFARYGTAATLRADTLQFLAGPGIAFGTNRLRVRSPHRCAAVATALLPAAPHTAAGSIDFHGLMARFWLRAAAVAGQDEPAVSHGREESSSVRAANQAALSR